MSLEGGRHLRAFAAENKAASRRDSWDQCRQVRWDPGVFQTLFLANAAARNGGLGQ